MTPARQLGSYEWPHDRLADALSALARAAGSESQAQAQAQDQAQASHANDVSPETFIVAARAAGLDAEPFDLPATDPLATLRRAIPAVLISVAGGAGSFVVLRAGRRTTTLMGPDGSGRIATTALEDALWTPVEADAGAPVSRILRDTAAVPPRRRTAARRALLAPGLKGRPIGEGWMLRPIVTTFRDSLRGAKVYRRSAAIIGAYLLQLVLFLAIWRQVGARAFAGPDASTPGAESPDWTGFMMLLGSWVVVQLVASTIVSRLALDLGGAVRAGLMRGALRLDPGRIRTAGVGQLLGRALDAEVLDTLALGGGVEATAGLFELMLGAVVLALGALPFLSLALWGLTLGGVGALAWIHARRLAAWCHTRRALTHDLVERMIGHRTTLVQDRPARRAPADRSALEHYDLETRALDRAEVWLAVGLPRGWLLAGLLVLAPYVLRSAGPPGPAMAMSVGGIWLVYGALRRLGVAVPMLSLAREAWRQIAPLVGASESQSTPASPAAGDSTAVARIIGAPAGDRAGSSASGGGAAGPPLLEAIGIGYQYPGRPVAVLEGVHFALAAGDRVLVEGASGGGKSTLAALLTGLKPPAAGTLRLRGVDQRSIGLGRWRRAIAGAPQFHDNHVLGADLLFNLLMGRRWPPRIEDIAAAERVCRDLGLGPLLGRMPAGLQQLVGETGWQLSHGERSRIFVARSLLQVLDARVLDESFAALDPETLDEVLSAVLSRPEALIVIAHP
jgi:ATP-binding cassette subfamily B protein